MSYEKVILDLESNNLMHPMLDYTQKPLRFNLEFTVWCLSLRCVDTNESKLLVRPDLLANIDKYITTVEQEIALSKIPMFPLTKEQMEIDLKNCEELIAHNGIKFDFPVLKVMDLLDYNIGYPYLESLDNTFDSTTSVFKNTAQITDTMIWSKLLNADRMGGHSLKNFGSSGTNEKIDFHDFENFSAEMLIYCDQDTSVNRDAYLELMQEKGSYEKWETPYLMEAKLADMSLNQELFGFAYDLELSERCKVELDILLKERYDEVTPQLPNRPLNKGEQKFFTPPKTKFSASANRISAAMTRFMDKVGGEYNPISNEYTVDGITYDLYSEECVKKSLPADIKDLDHLKSYLISLGWIPSQWNIRDLTKDSKKKPLTKEKFLDTLDRYVDNTYNGFFKESRLRELEFHPETSEKALREYFVNKYNSDRKASKSPLRVPTSPPLKVGTSKELCPNLESMKDELPFIRAVTEFFTYQHRRNSISGNVDEESGDSNSGFESYLRTDGRVATPVDTLATNTSRMAHREICNIPRVESVYGGNIRALFGSGKDHLQFGFDFSSLEARIQGHYCIPYTDGAALAETLVATKPNDIHCYSEDTEILTLKGWKLFGDLNSEDLVAQWNINSVIEFIKPTDIVWQKYKGDMIKFNHMLVTPNHRMVLEDTKTKKFKVKTAKECSEFISQLNYPIKGIIDGSDEHCYEIYELLIATQADGCFNKDSNSITFNFVKKRKVDRLLKLLDSVNANYSLNLYERNNKTQTVIRMLAKDPVTLLIKSFFDSNKKLLINFMTLSLKTKTKLIKSIGYWDGTYSKTGNAIILDSTDFEFVDSLQALSHTSGFKCSLTTFNKNTSYGDVKLRRAYINLKSTSRGSLHNCAENIQYEGYIGCVSVPTGFIVVRREDKVFVSGNTLNGEKLGISRGDAKAISYACVPEDTEVYSHQSGWIPISKIRPEKDLCVSIHSTDDLRYNYFTPIEKLHVFTDKEVFELTTDLDTVIKCTLDHRWFVLDHDDNRYKYIETSEYFEGDYSIVKSVQGVAQTISYFKFKEIKSIGIQKTYCITTNTSNFYMKQGEFETITGNCLYGASPGKLCKMLSLSPEEGEKLYEDYWDALPALKELKEKVEAFWESTGNSYILGIDGRKLMARSKHSLLNLLFQGGGSIAVKYSLVLASQRLAEIGALGDVFKDTHEESLEKVYQMIMYHK